MFRLLRKHYSDGKKYLCQTKREDWESYRGSGLLVGEREVVKTDLLGEFESKEELAKAGIHFSNLWNVVESQDYLNLTREEGQGGYTVYTKERGGKISNKLKNKPKSLEHRRKLSEANQGNVLARNLKTGENVVVSKEEFESSEHLVGIASVTAKGIPKSEEWKEKLRKPCPAKGEHAKKPVMCEGTYFSSKIQAINHYKEYGVSVWEMNKRFRDELNKDFVVI